MNMKGKEKNLPFLDKTIDFIFSNDSRKWLLLIFILGLILRVIVASNLEPVADEMVHGVHAIGFSKLAPLSTLTQGPIWYYLTDYAYRLLGVSLLSARFLSVLFGSLSIIVVYLLGNRLFTDKRLSLAAAFLLSISAFHSTWAASYQDQAMMFFILLASYFFIKTYRDSGKISLISAVFLAIAELIKIITGAFILVFGFCMVGILYHTYKRNRPLFRENIKRIILFGVILIIALLPLFSYNYFLYQEKGIVDLPLAQFLRINPEFYTGPGLHHEEGFVLNKLPRNLYAVISVYFLKEDLLIFLLGVLGIIYMVSTIKQKMFEKIFLLGMFFFVLIFIASSIVLQTHYTSFVPLLALFGASTLGLLTTHPKTRQYGKLLLWSILCLILVYNLIQLGGPLTSKSGVDKLRSFAVSSIDQNTLVVVDARIYRGTIAWLFNDKHYIESSYLAQVLRLSNEAPQKYPVKTVFIECIIDDCGWGTVKDQPDFNETTEAIVTFFKGGASRLIEIKGGGAVKGVRGVEIAGEPIFRVYEATLQLDPRLLVSVDQTHEHFFYHIPRNEQSEKAFDYYTVKGGKDTLLNLFSYGVLYLCLGIALLSIALPFYLLFKEK